MAVAFAIIAAIFIVIETFTIGVLSQYCSDLIKQREYWKKQCQELERAYNKEVN